MVLKTLKKSKPFFGAGKKFGWIGAGVGINADLLYDERITTFEVFIGYKKPVYIMRYKALLDVTVWNSWMKGKGDKLVGVIPYSDFTNIKSIDSTIQLPLL